MAVNRVDMWLMSHSAYFKPEHMPIITDQLSRLDESQANVLLSLQLKNPTTLLLLSIFIGELGVDRFMLGQIGLGLLKLFTLGGCLIWWVIDIFLISGATKDYNYAELMKALAYLPTAHYHAPQPPQNDRLQ